LAAISFATVVTGVSTLCLFGHERTVRTPPAKDWEMISS
jgi:hypothetical protein